MDIDHSTHNTDREQYRKRSRAWMGTIWDDKCKDLLKALSYKYLIISDDDHTQENELHWHCLITFEQARNFPKIPNIHWERCQSRTGARDYCLAKGNNFFEDGQLTVDTSNEADWSGFVNACKTQEPNELIDGPFSKLYAQYRGFAGEVHNRFVNLKIIDGELINEWYYGEPGTGKTKKAWNENPKLYIKPLNKWWDGYNGEDVVLLDDWDPKHDVLVSHLKQWADRYPFRAEMKGSSIMARPKKIIVTSNYSIDECFQNPQDVDAIKRRFKIHKFSKLRNNDE